MENEMDLSIARFIREQREREEQEERERLRKRIHGGRRHCRLPRVWIAPPP